MCSKGGLTTPFKQIHSLNYYKREKAESGKAPLLWNNNSSMQEMLNRSWKIWNKVSTIHILWLMSSLGIYMKTFQLVRRLWQQIPRASVSFNLLHSTHFPRTVGKKTKKRKVAVDYYNLRSSLLLPHPSTSSRTTIMSAITLS